MKTAERPILWLLAIAALVLAWVAKSGLSRLEARVKDSTSAQAMFNSWTASQMAANAQRLVRDGKWFEFDTASELPPDGTNVLGQPGRRGRWVKLTNEVNNLPKF